MSSKLIDLKAKLLPVGSSFLHPGAFPRKYYIARLKATHLPCSHSIEELNRKQPKRRKWKALKRRFLPCSLALEAHSTLEENRSRKKFAPQLKSSLTLSFTSPLSNIAPLNIMLIAVSPSISLKLTSDPSCRKSVINVEWLYALLTIRAEAPIVSALDTALTRSSV